VRGMGVKLGPLTLWEVTRLSMFENTYCKENVEALTVAVKETGLEVNAGNTKPYLSIDNAHLIYNAHPTFSTFLLMYR
jgi:hypothetical protein